MDTAIALGDCELDLEVREGEEWGRLGGHDAVGTSSVMIDGQEQGERLQGDV